MCLVTCLRLQKRNTDHPFLSLRHDVQNNNEEDFRKIYATLKVTVTTDKTKQHPSSGSTKETNPLFTKGQQLTKLCRDILQCHQITDRDSQQHKPMVPREIWEQDYQKMRQLLDYGKKYGEKLVEGIISPSSDVGKGDHKTPSSIEGENGGEDLGEPETLAVGLFDKSKKKSEETETWGRVAHAQVKALAAVVRTVP